MRQLEFWPDYGGALLHEDGAAVPLDVLGLPPDLIEAATDWLARYDDARLEPETRDDAWIAEGRAIFERLRHALNEQATELVDWEGYWEPPASEAT
ncbi:MAG: hypothetical protein HYX55_07245 [Chloroflexi bacterium]|nr:hypothetical protein [Chloroflexota bacterium]